MNIPRHTNPHVLAQTTQPASRADLTRDSDVDELATGSDKEELRAHLDQILLNRGLDLKRLRQTTGDAGSGDRPSRKRRKVVHDDRSATTTVEEAATFRLISSSLPPKRIELVPKPPPVIQVREPNYEDTGEQSAQRAHQAQSIAVDSTWLANEATKPLYLLSNSRNKVVQLYAKLPSPHPPIMITERPKASNKTPRDIQTCLPSPHTFPITGLCCPIIATQHQNLTPNKKRKRCPKSKNKICSTRTNTHPF